MTYKQRSLQEKAVSRCAKQCNQRPVQLDIRVIILCDVQTTLFARKCRVKMCQAMPPTSHKSVGERRLTNFSSHAVSPVELDIRVIILCDVQTSLFARKCRVKMCQAMPPTSHKSVGERRLTNFSSHAVSPVELDIRVIILCDVHTTLFARKCRVKMCQAMPPTSHKSVGERRLTNFASHAVSPVELDIRVIILCDVHTTLFARKCRVKMCQAMPPTSHKSVGERRLTNFSSHAVSPVELDIRVIILCDVQTSLCARKCRAKMCQAMQPMSHQSVGERRLTNFSSHAVSPVELDIRVIILCDV